MKYLRLPGLVDIHVHLRDDDSGLWSHKEDFESGTRAALAGGYTTVLDMPNNPEAATSLEALQKKISHAQGRIYCDVGFHFGATTENFTQYEKVATKVYGLKIYMNHTTGQMLIDDRSVLDHIFKEWTVDKPILVHAEAEMLEVAIALAKKYRRRLHACHVSLKEEILMIKQAKKKGLPVTCEVSCHHLFLTENNVVRLGSFGIMKPPLASQKDVDALWKNLDIVDCIASDHAPHTLSEKKSEKPPFGVPGLETSLPLMLNAASEGRLSMEKLIDLMSTSPKRIFNIPDQPETFIDVDPTKKWTISAMDFYTKAGWTPFEGQRVVGSIESVTLRGKKVFSNHMVLGKPSGRVVC